MKERDLDLLRRAFDAARRARKRGNLPFGAVLVDPEGEVIMEGENTVNSDSDCIAHAEINLIHAAGKKYNPEFLSRCTIYTSAEPCPMCAAAIYWSGVQRLVFGLSKQRVHDFTGREHPEDIMDMSARLVLESGGRRVLVTGPLLEKEAEEVHQGFWQLPG